jgi:hypothetical protein
MILTARHGGGRFPDVYDRDPYPEARERQENLIKDSGENN